VIDFNSRNRNKILNNDLKTKSNNLNLFESNIVKKKKKLFHEIAKIDDNSNVKKMELKSKMSDIMLPSNNSTKQMLFKAKKNIDLEELKGMVMDRIIEFKNSRGFMTEDFDSNKKMNKISKVKYDLFGFMNKKK